MPFFVVFIDIDILLTDDLINVLERDKLHTFNNVSTIILESICFFYWSRMHFVLRTCYYSMVLLLKWLVTKLFFVNKDFVENLLQFVAS